MLRRVQRKVTIPSDRSTQRRLSRQSIENDGRSIGSDKTGPDHKHTLLAVLRSGCCILRALPQVDRGVSKEFCAIASARSSVAHHGTDAADADGLDARPQSTPGP